MVYTVVDQRHTEVAVMFIEELTVMFVEKLTVMFIEELSEQRRDYGGRTWRSSRNALPSLDHSHQGFFSKETSVTNSESCTLSVCLIYFPDMLFLTTIFHHKNNTFTRNWTNHSISQSLRKRCEMTPKFNSLSVIG